MFPFVIIQTPISRIDFPAPRAALPLVSLRRGLFPRPTANQKPARPAEASDWLDRRLEERGAAFRSSKNLQTEVCSRNETGHLLDFYPFLPTATMQMIPLIPLVKLHSINFRCDCTRQNMVLMNVIANLPNLCPFIIIYS